MPFPLAPQALVGSVLSAEEVEVWEGLELQRTLMGMQDVVTCPRCDAYCIEVHFIARMFHCKTACCIGFEMPNRDTCGWVMMARHW